MLTLPPTSEVPLAMDQDGVIRFQNSRVTLDTIVEAFAEGATAEEIAHQYSTISLTDVYSAISFFLRRRDEVEDYLRERNRMKDEVRLSNEGRFIPNQIRERLMARRLPHSTSHAATGV